MSYEPSMYMYIDHMSRASKFIEFLLKLDLGDKWNSSTCCSIARAMGNECPLFRGAPSQNINLDNDLDY